MRRYFLSVLFISLSLPFLFAQQLNHPPISNVTYNKSDGFLLDHTYSMEFDENNWLWISGTTAEAENFKLGNVVGIIQRFNGNAFYNVELPDPSLKNSTAIYLIKKSDNKLIVRFEKGLISKLYLLDTETIEFTPIPVPDDTLKNHMLKIFKLKSNHFLCLFTNSNRISFYILNEQLEFSYLNETNQLDDLSIKFFIELNDYYVISNSSKTIMYSKQGKEIKKLNKKDLGLDTQILDDIVIKSGFVRRDTTYLRFLFSDKHYYYSKSDKKWKPTYFFKSEQNITEPNAIYDSSTFIDKNGNVLNQKAYPNKVVIEQYSEDLNASDYFYINHFSSSLSTVASRDLTKEFIYITNDGLQVVVYERPNVSVFLKNFSIRSMLQLNDEEVLIATDFNGWYLLNIKTKNIKPYVVTKDGLKHELSLNRNMFLGQNGIWSNDHNSLTYTNTTSKELTSFLETTTISTMGEEGSYIYFGDHNSNLKRFDKTIQEITTLIETDSLVFQDIIAKDRNIFAATNSGLLCYNDNEYNLYQPSKIEDDNFLLSADYNSTYGLIVGSRSGKLYQFDLDSKSFHLLYEDELGASIASTLYDSNKNIWINTFAGIVVLKPDSTTTRYDQNDGLSHHEANRYSALKLTNGSFLTGTLKGLNYFNPDNLIKQSQDNKLKLTLFNAFDKKTKSSKVIVNPSDLEKINHIKLPASNRNMTMQFSLLGSFYNSNVVYRYRLNQNDWIELRDEFELRLSNLAPGKYTLEVEAIDNTKNRIGNSLVYTITSKEVFYKTVWFGLLFVGLLVSLFLIYERKKRQIQFARFENQLLETELKYKQRDLSDFAMNISRNQQWRTYILELVDKIKSTKGRSKGVNIIALENEIKQRNNIEKTALDFQKRVDILNNEFYDRLLKQFPNLSKTEMKLCSLIKLNLESKDIAVLQNIELKSVHQSRFRLRKKLNLPSDTNLNTFFKNF